MLTFIVLFVFLTNTSILLSEPRVEWIRSIGDGGNDQFNDLYALTNGDYALCGESDDEFWVVRIDPNGNVLWSETYGNWRAKSLIETDGGDILAAGNSGTISAILINDDGEEIWSNAYTLGTCNAVIELKSGNFLLGGYSYADNVRCGHLTLIDQEGELLWERQYPREIRGEFYSMRETEGGVVLAGRDQNDDEETSFYGWLLKADLDNEGEVIWSRSHDIGNSLSFRSITSVPGGGFVTTGIYKNYDIERVYTLYFTMKVNDEGNLQWFRHYGNDNGARWGTCIVTVGNNGLIGVGHQRAYQHRGYFPNAVRVNNQGGILWEAKYELDNMGDTPSSLLNSVIVDNDNSIVAAGYAHWQDRNGINGLVMKLEPEVIGPIIFEWSPQDTVLTVLQGDTIDFWVRAFDQQGDEMSYMWMVNEDTLGNDSAETVEFENLGLSDVRCFVSDGENISFINWSVSVQEFYIGAFQPDSLELTVRRGNSVEFTLGVRALEEIEVEYSWTFIDRNQRMHQLDAESDSISFEFEFAGDQAIIGEVTRGEVSHDLRWNVQVRSNVWYWWPHELVMRVPEDTLMEFKVFPFEDEEDSLELEYSWFLDGNGVDADSNVIELRMSDIGAHVVSALVSDSLEADTIVWELDVYDPAGISDRIGSLLPVEAILYPTSPNPFNSKVNLSFHLPQPEFGELTIYDLSGRKVQTVFQGVASSGKTYFTWDATFRPAGVYLVEFRTSSTTYVRKMILLR